MRDPYSVLGVKKDARDDEIKAAWRARAKSVHPDHNSSDPLAAARFAEVGAAYDLLKDPDKRRRYDARRRKSEGEGEPTIMQKRQAEREAAARAKAAKAEADRVMEELARANAQRAAKAAKETVADATQETPEAMVNRIFGGGNGGAAMPGGETQTGGRTTGAQGASAARPQAEGVSGADASAARSEPDIEDISPQEDSRAPGAPLSVQAVEFISNWIRRLRGLEPAPEKAPDMHAETVVALNDLIRGGKAEVKLSDGRDLRFLLQPGVTDGHVVKFEGHGLRIPGMQKGDLIVTVKIAPDVRFRTEGFDIHTILPVTLENAVLGCDCTVETPEGPMDISIPAWSDSNRSIRLTGKGLRETLDHRGDLVVEIRLILWEKPDDKVTDLMRHMREGLFI